MALLKSVMPQAVNKARAVRRPFLNWRSQAAVLLGVGLLFTQLGAQAASSEQTHTSAAGVELLQRMQQAARELDYNGVFIYQHGSHLAASHIVHEGSSSQGERRGRERIELLDGPKQREFLREDKLVYSLLPEIPLVLVEQRETDHFPALVTGDPAALQQWYTVEVINEPGRVAGRPCTQAELQPRDEWRWGYRVCVDQEHGLLLKVQTLNHDGEVLEQAAFSELDIGDPIRPEELESRHDWRSWKHVQGGRKAENAARLWRLQAPAGFLVMSETERRLKGRSHVHQTVLSDGLAAVSVFIEPIDPTSEQVESVEGYGATSIYRGRKNDWWVTVLGEVPPHTVRAVADSLVH